MDNSEKIAQMNGFYAMPLLLSLVDIISRVVFS